MSEIEEWVGEVHQGNAKKLLKQMPKESVDCVITSPPYWNLRDYGEEEQLGQEDDYEQYINNLADICDLIYDVLKDNGSFWLNLGDTFQNKNKLNIPYRVAIELQSRGWIERNDVTWAKPNPVPQSVKDRLNVTTESFFHFVKQKQYFYDLDKIREPHKQVSKDRVNQGPTNVNSEEIGNDTFDVDQILHEKGKNPGDVFEVLTKPMKEAHFAPYPVKLLDKPIKSSCPEDGIILDPFIGSGTTAIAAEKYNREWVGIDLNKDYVDMSYDRVEDETTKIFDDGSVFDY